MTSHSIFRSFPHFPKFLALVIFLASGVALSFQATAQVFTNLHNLALIDGSGPVANLIVSSNVLYGTAHIYGGGNGGGSGSIFRLNIDGSGFTNLHTFSGTAPEGGGTGAALVLSGKTLYTTATFGGGSNYGCIVAMGIDGSGLTNIYNFSALLGPFPSTNIDGGDPTAGLILSGGTLYGLASGGGQHGWGTLFAVSTNGTGFTNLHNFTSTDGQNPGTDLMLAGGTLFGATAAGGQNHYGTLYRIGTNGAGYTNFYSFPANSGPDRTNYEGVFPTCSLVLSGTNLYGTASEGGDLGGGTVFMIDTNGTALTTLHAFATTNGITGTNIGGARPTSGLTLLGNVFYGTTSAGGNSGNGTVYKINTDGSGFTTLYNFSATNGFGTNGTGGGTNFDGAHPVGGLLSTGGALYGTASEGGTASFGTLFSISFPPTLGITLSGTNAILSWPTNPTGYNLESTTNLSSTNWNLVAGQYSVTNPISGRQKFYRLKLP